MKLVEDFGNIGRFMNYTELFYECGFMMCKVTIYVT